MFWNFHPDPWERFPTFDWVETNQISHDSGAVFLGGLGIDSGPCIRCLQDNHWRDPHQWTCKSPGFAVQENMQFFWGKLSALYVVISSKIIETTICKRTTSSKLYQIVDFRL